MTAQTKPQWGEAPRAKEHPLLKQLTGELRGCAMSETFDVAGHKYTLRSLSPLEESWADGHVDGQNLYQAGRNRRAPYVAAALEAIDGVNVRELFALPETGIEPAVREVYLNNDMFLTDWRRGQVLRFVAEDLQPEVLMQLWNSYLELAGRREEALEKLGPLSKRTSIGESSVTSSVAKAS